MTGMLSGGCLCGKVEYQVADAFDDALVCHCSQCRRATGAANKPFGGIARAKLAVIRGADLVAVYGRDDEGDRFCRACGSLMWSVVRDGAYVHVTYGTLHGAPSKLPEAHIFVGSKAAWERIDDGLPQFDTRPGAGNEAEA